MHRIDRDKIATLTRALEMRGGNPHYVICWLESMLALMDSRVGLTEKQVRAFNAMLDENIKWASDPK